MSAMEQLYQQLILDHARAAHGKTVLTALDEADGAPPDPAPEAIATAAALGPHAVCGESFQVNPTCGDQIRLRVDLTASDGVPKLAHVRWEGVGCTISQAAASVMVDLVEGKSVSDADQIGEVFRELMHSQGEGVADEKEDLLGDAIAFEGVAQYPARVKCALLGWMALRDAIVQASASAGDHTKEKAR